MKMHCRYYTQLPTRLGLFLSSLLISLSAQAQVVIELTPSQDQLNSTTAVWTFTGVQNEQAKASTVTGNGTSMIDSVSGNLGGLGSGTISLTWSAIDDQTAPIALSTSAWNVGSVTPPSGGFHSNETGFGVLSSTTDGDLESTEAILLSIDLSNFTLTDTSGFLVFNFSLGAGLSMNVHTRMGANSAIVETASISLDGDVSNHITVTGNDYDNDGIHEFAFLKNTQSGDVRIDQMSLAVVSSPVIDEDLSGIRTYSYTGAGIFDQGESHDIKVYFPSGHSAQDPKPAFVFFHGGGWFMGDLTQGDRMCEYLASRGMVAITANYTLMDDPVREAEVQGAGLSRKRYGVMDAKTVVRWVKANAASLGIDPERLAAGGSSAGGHLSVLQMMDPNINNPYDLNLGMSTDVQAFVLFTPAFSILSTDDYPEVNVYQYLEEAFPPTLFIVSDVDPWEPRGEPLALALIEAGQTVDYWMGLGQPHGFSLKRAEARIPTFLKVDDFLRRLGFLEGQPTVVPDAEDISFEFIHWGDDISNVCDVKNWETTAGGDYQFTYERPVERTKLIYNYQASNTIDPTSWVPITPTVTVQPSVDGIEPVQVSGLEQAASAAGITATEGGFFRVSVEGDLYVAPEE